MILQRMSIVVSMLLAACATVPAGPTVKVTPLGTHAGELCNRDRAMIFEDPTGVRVLYAYYFGTRQLTANKAITQPSDLAGLKIRAIPFPIYMSTVQGLGAVPVPVDWSEVPTALATGQVAGQENPVNVVLSSKLYETQSHMMLTSHIMNAQLIVINEKAWQALAPAQREQIAKAADEVRRKATDMVKSQEAEELEKLKGLKMTVLGPANGLKLDAFKASVNKVVQEKFGAKYGDLYREIAAVR